MKLFILAVDALEYDFIESRDYAHLKQEQFFKVKIPRRCMTIFEDGNLSPWTPLIWKAILTGGISQRKPKPKPEQHWVGKLLKNKLLTRIRLARGINSLYRFLVSKLSKAPAIQEIRRGIPLQDQHTIMVRADNPAVINNPLEAPIEWGVPKALHSDFHPREIVRSHLEKFRKIKKETLSKVDRDWDLFLIYNKLLDIVGHLYWQKNHTVEKYYSIMDNFAGEIQRKLSDEAFMVIISDHGMRPLKGTKHQGGEHSHHAFVSFNHKLPIGKLSFTDIYPLLTEIMEEQTI
ncbi:hypothetical protein AKJ48_03000 [candidate division MSBL1 archaeon SCGC-AAA261O19]|uniref:Metalloenzyme domain-containing protein n=1 Tax=candidate division MSBL1 archaeon SCGC-AAA261O19 TaxID=1698277 RepID=A0A133VD16_9EURY|nr:hypothetical protein AKJ48_03000 [candidate division MSBL1 archaeon SCGC-AAA261O19]